jgi:phosphatidylinositol-3-phosphatase
MMLKRKRWITALAVLIAAGIGATIVACSDSGSTSPNASLVSGKVKHVWVITLENENYSTTFGANTPSPYLAKTLTAQGALLSGYYGTGHVSLDNYVSMLSGQPGTPQTVSDCTTYADFKQTNTTFQDQLPVGTGCVYPANVKTLPDQLKAKSLTWKGYMGDMGNDPARESATYGHPALNAIDLTQTAEAPSAAVPLGDQYATRHNPFAYFHSIIDSPDCQANVVNLDKNLQNDLASISTTANFNFITPSLCDDGHDAPCVDGRPGGWFLLMPSCRSGFQSSSLHRHTRLMGLSSSILTRALMAAWFHRRPELRLRSTAGSAAASSPVRILQLIRRPPRSQRAARSTC